MQATREDLDGLLNLQHIDLDVRRLNKELEELPQRSIIVSLREKRAGIEEQRDKVEEVKRATVRKLTRIDDEDASLQKKEQGVQAAIDAAHGDFRNVEARTKELAGIARRRETIACDRARVQTELDKVKNIEAQVNLALEELQSKEQKTIASFQQQGGSIKADLAKLQAARREAVSRIDKELLALYEKTSARTGGVAIGVLEQARCGACRTTIDGGRLIDLKNQAPLGVCPSCKRLLIIP